MNCQELQSMRAHLETLRDQRRGRLADKILLAQFMQTVREYDAAVTTHRIATGCTEFH
jgi:hypothetical protein